MATRGKNVSRGRFITPIVWRTYNERDLFATPEQLRTNREQIMNKTKGERIGNKT
jgi:hypothetical protein